MINMKNSLHGVIAIIGLIGFISCQDDTKRELMKELQTTIDSATVLYYDTANNPRFFKYVKVPEVKFLSPVISDVNKRVINKRDDCATQGKIYFYGKAGAVHIVYFSDSGDCMTFSFIITGEKYFVKMSESSGMLLKELKHKAKEPSTN